MLLSDSSQVQSRCISNLRSLVPRNDSLAPDVWAISSCGTTNRLISPGFQHFPQFLKPTTSTTYGGLNILAPTMPEQRLLVPECQRVEPLQRELEPVELPARLKIPRPYPVSSLFLSSDGPLHRRNVRPQFGRGYCSSPSKFFKASAGMNLVFCKNACMNFVRQGKLQRSSNCHRRTTRKKQTDTIGTTGIGDRG